MEANVTHGVLRARATLNAQLTKAGDAVKKAERGLNAAITAYRKTHNAAARQKRLVPTSKHAKLINGVIKAQEKLAKNLRELLAVEGDWKEYFRPL
jgi:hypothetical protein